VEASFQTLNCEDFESIVVWFSSVFINVFMELHTAHAGLYSACLREALRCDTDEMK